MHFRKQPKVFLGVMVPEAIEDEIRDRAKRRSLSEAASEILCVGLNIDPKVYGIDPSARKVRRHGGKAGAAAAS